MGQGRGRKALWELLNGKIGWNRMCAMTCYAMLDYTPLLRSPLFTASPHRLAPITVQSLVFKVLFSPLLFPTHPIPPTQSNPSSSEVILCHRTRNSHPSYPDTRTRPPLPKPLLRDYLCPPSLKHFHLHFHLLTPPHLSSYLKPQPLTLPQSLQARPEQYPSERHSP